MDKTKIQYQYSDSDHAHSHSYLLPSVIDILENVAPKTVFDLGCGNGSLTKKLSDLYEVTGVDTSEDGIALANSKYPDLNVEIGSAYDDLAAKYGAFDAVVSLEVVEHLFDPRLYAKRCYQLLKPGGTMVCSTPYHGYLKNLLLAISGKMDRHFTALWDGGHIKFWSIDSLTKLLSEAGFHEIRFERVGRIPQLAKSMIAIAQKPEKLDLQTPPNSFLQNENSPR